MSAPLVVNTVDGTVWTRREAVRDGQPLYALAGCGRCPEIVMATYAELAEHGIVGSADVLPVPVGPEPQAQSLPLAVVAELNDLRMRLAGMANPPREVYLALYEGAEPELFTTVEAARECCDDLAKTDAGENYWDWTVNKHGIHIQFWTHADDDRPLSETSGAVTPIVVQGDDDLSELERLRREAESNRVDGQRLIRAEQRRAELEAVLATHRKDDQAEIERLRARVAELEAERHVTNEALDEAVQELRTSYAERAQRETHPGRRQAWRMLAQAEESERVANALLTPEAPRSADKLTALLAPTQTLQEGEAGESSC